MELDTIQLSSTSKETIEPKPKGISPFTFINSFTDIKDYIFDDETSRDYSPYVINRGLSNHPDCLFLANEMNQYKDIPKKSQYDFYFYGIEKKKRYASWAKNEKDEDIDLIMNVFQYSRAKAEQVISLLTQEQLTIMRSRNGGRTRTK